ncbi:MAG: sulfite exporter TauE/SafE family protein [Burkholderiales bacterium]|nr:sulfite exporter TauE/SafE family protein [Burkholderiales bacterium]
MDLFLPIAHTDVSVPLILAFGAVVGFLSGLVGVGGGFLITPLLIFTGIPPIVAVSTGATQMAGTAAGASYIQWTYGNIDFRMAFILLAGSLAGSGAGVALARALVRNGDFGTVVVFLYVLLLGGVGIAMFVESLRAVLRAGALAPPAPATRPRWRFLKSLAGSLPLQTGFRASGIRMSALVPFVLGGFAGILTALMGVGGGFIMVPLMIYLLRMPTPLAVGTSMFQLLFTTAATSVMHAGINHTVDPLLAGILILGSILGTAAGARLGRRLPAEKLRLILAIVVVGVAVRMALTLVIAPVEPYGFGTTSR